jgi:hypothetical protein
MVNMVNPQPFYEWGPYLAYGTDPSREMNVSWESEHYALDAWVKFGETDACDQKLAWQADAPRRHHHFLLRGLKPNTTY